MSDELELLKKKWKPYCEMCGNDDGLEIAIDPAGNLKTLCDECRIGSILLLEARIRQMAKVLSDFDISGTDDHIQYLQAEKHSEGQRPVRTVEQLRRWLSALRAMWRRYSNG